MEKWNVIRSGKHSVVLMEHNKIHEAQHSASDLLKTFRAQTNFCNREVIKNCPSQYLTLLEGSHLPLDFAQKKRGEDKAQIHCFSIPMAFGRRVFKFLLIHDEERGCHEGMSLLGRAHVLG